MNIIYILIPLSVVLMAIAIYFFFWAVRNDQFDDLDTPALDILDDDEEPASDNQRKTNREDAKNAKKG